MIENFTDEELFSIYQKLHEIYHSHKLIQFFLNCCPVDENGNYFWTGTTQQLARLLGNGKGDNLCPSNFRKIVIQPLLDKGIVLKEKLKWKTTRYVLIKDWKKVLFA